MSSKSSKIPNAVKTIKGMCYGSASYAYFKHYNSNPHFQEKREPLYTFFADMMVYIYLENSNEKALEEIKKYVKRMMRSYGKYRDAYCIMVDSLNILGWYCYGANGNNACPLSDYLFAEYNHLMWGNVWKNYITEDEFNSIVYELD